MKIVFSKSVTAVAFNLLAASCSVALADPSHLTANSGKTLRLAFASEEKPDCTFAGMPVVHVVKDATHGRIRIQTEQAYPSFDEDNPRYFCNEWRVKGLGVYYTSDDGYVGDDFVSLHFDFGGGDETTDDYAITVQ
ncbi:MAG: hypothetical protein ABSF67_14600 [Roseiarcus sp.]